MWQCLGVILRVNCNKTDAFGVDLAVPMQHSYIFPSSHPQNGHQGVLEGTGSWLGGTSSFVILGTSLCMT